MRPVLEYKEQFPAKICVIKLKFNYTLVWFYSNLCEHNLDKNANLCIYSLSLLRSNCSFRMRSIYVS